MIKVKYDVLTTPNDGIGLNNNNGYTLIKKVYMFGLKISETTSIKIGFMSYFSYFSTHKSDVLYIIEKLKNNEIDLIKLKLKL